MEQFVNFWALYSYIYILISRWHNRVGVTFQSFVDWRLASLTGSFFKQSIFKQLLTEGNLNDIFIMVKFLIKKKVHVEKEMVVETVINIITICSLGEKYIMTVFGVLNFGDQGNHIFLDTPDLSPPSLALKHRLSN